MHEAPRSLIDAIAGAPTDDERAHRLHWAARFFLDDPSGIATVAQMAVSADDQGESDVAFALLARALYEARMASENNAPEGDALIEAITTTLSAEDATSPFHPVVRMRLAGTYARAGLAPPDFARLTPEMLGTPEADIPLSDEAPDIGVILDDLIRVVGDEPLQVHAAIGEVLAGLPAEFAAMLVAAIVARPGRTEARLGLYWLMGHAPHLSAAAAKALRERAEAGTLPPDEGALLPAMRKWLPEGAVRDLVDATIRRLVRDGAARSRRTGPVVQRAAASLPDGAGAQSLVAAVQAGKARSIAMVMLKQGHGVKDAFVIPCASAAEQKRTLAGVLAEIEMIDVAPGAVADAIAMGIGEGLASGHPPAPGLVDIIAILGADTLAPVASDTGAILAAIGAREALSDLSSERRSDLSDASAEAVDRLVPGHGWFEESASLRASIARARTGRGRATAVWKHLETRRDWWARQFAVSAATLKAAARPEPELWLSFAAAADALLAETPLRTIPLMHAIVETTLWASDACGIDDAAALADTPLSGADDGTADPLARAGFSEPFLLGYFTALAMSPLPATPQSWLGPLVVNIVFPNETAVDHTLGIIMSRAHRIDDDVADPEKVRAMIAGLDAAALRDWTAGFEALVTADKRAWPSKSLAPDDKRMLKEISAAAKGGDASALRALLPTWVARRRAFRR